MFLLFSLQADRNLLLDFHQHCSLWLLCPWQTLSNLETASYILSEESWLGKLPFHSSLVLSVFQSVLNTLFTHTHFLNWAIYILGDKQQSTLFGTVAYRAAMAKQCTAGNWQTLFFLSWLQTNKSNLPNTCKINIKMMKYYLKIPENTLGTTI